MQVARSQDIDVPAASRSRARAVAPDRNPDFAHLSLSALRTYRTSLSDEEGRVSYWRRILQARLDMVRSIERGGTGDVANLRDVISETRVSSGRTALITFVPVDDIPPLPNLVELWDRDPVPGDAEGNAALVHQLVAAEAELSAYRAALHRRISAATDELIARYHEDPTSCLAALPLPPPRAAASH